MGAVLGLFVLIAFYFKRWIMFIVCVFAFLGLLIFGDFRLENFCMFFFSFGILQIFVALYKFRLSKGLK